MTDAGRIPDHSAPSVARIRLLSYGAGIDMDNLNGDKAEEDDGEKANRNDGKSEHPSIGDPGRH